MIGGNITAKIQTRTTAKNDIGEDVSVWADKSELFGFLDFSSGQNNISTYNAKLQETTHIFISDYYVLNDITSENSRFVVNNNVYQVLLIDDPMELHEHLEIYLKYVGGGL